MSDTVAVVTGAGAGIGRACAVGLAEAGHVVIAADREIERAEGTAEIVIAAGGSAVPTVVDVSHRDQMDCLVHDTARRQGKLKVFVNNAAIFRTHPLIQTRDEVWHETLAVNLTGVFFGCRAAAREMIATEAAGRIVNVTSMHAAVSEPGGSAYTATKAGVEGLTRTLASELAPHQITVNCVRPGATHTKLTEPIYSDDVLAALRQRIPLGEIAEPEWIAAGVIWFASEQARYATGSVLTIDGGYSMDGALPGLAYGEG